MRRWKLIPTHLTALRTVNPYAEADPYAFGCPTHRQFLRRSWSLRIYQPYAPSAPTRHIFFTGAAFMVIQPHLYHFLTSLKHCSLSCISIHAPAVFHRVMNCWADRTWILHDQRPHGCYRPPNDRYGNWMICVEYAGIGVRCRLSGYRLSGYGLGLWLFRAAKVAHYGAILSLFSSS